MPQSLEVRLINALSARGNQRLAQFVENALSEAGHACVGGGSMSCIFAMRDESFVEAMESFADKCKGNW